MHLKNFSLWKDPRSGLIRMSPGYDLLSIRLLIPATQDNEELALPVNGRKNNLNWSDFLTFGENLNIQRKVLERVRDKMLPADLSMACFKNRHLVSKEVGRPRSEGSYSKITLTV